MNNRLTREKKMFSLKEKNREYRIYFVSRSNESTRKIRERFRINPVSILYAPRR